MFTHRHMPRRPAPECNRQMFCAGEELIEAAKRNDFCKVLVPGSGFFPLAAPSGPGEWGLWAGPRANLLRCGHLSSPGPLGGLRVVVPVSPAPHPCPAHNRCPCIRASWLILPVPGAQKGSSLRGTAGSKARSSVLLGRPGAPGVREAHRVSPALQKDPQRPLGSLGPV